jgi:hypothetical protein
LTIEDTTHALRRARALRQNRSIGAIIKASALMLRCELARRKPLPPDGRGRKGGRAPVDVPPGAKYFVCAHLRSTLSTISCSAPMEPGAGVQWSLLQRLRSDPRVIQAT